MDTHSEIVKVLNRATDDGANRTADYADALVPLVRRAQAEALREAADDDEFSVADPEGASDDFLRGVDHATDELFKLLRERALHIEKEGAGA